MKRARILIVLTALAVIGTEVTSFKFPLQIPTSFSSWLPFTFNVTKDYTDLGSVTLNIFPKLRRQDQATKIKRALTPGLTSLDEKLARLNSKDSRLFSPLTERWELGIPSGASLLGGSTASFAGILWTLIAKNLEYRKKHGEFQGKHPNEGGKTNEFSHIVPPTSSYGYNVPSYGSDNSFPSYQKPEKGFDGFLKGSKGFKQMQAQIMKGFTTLVGLRNLNNLLHPGQKPKKFKLRKKPVQQQQYYEPSVYYPTYTSQEYSHQPFYESPSAYAPPPHSPSYAPPPDSPSYAPPPDSPSYAPPPEDTLYVPPPDSPSYASPPGVPSYAPQEDPSYAPQEDPSYAPQEDPSYAPQEDPSYAPPPEYVPAPITEPEPALVHVAEQTPVYGLAPEPPSVYAPAHVDTPAQVNVLALPPNEPPAEYSPTNDFPNRAPMFSPPSWEMPPQIRVQQWNDPPVPAPEPNVSSLELQDTKTEPTSIPVAVFHSLPTQMPPTFIHIQTDGFLPIFPSPVDPLPFTASSTNEETAQRPKPMGDLPSFGVPPSSLSSSPPRSSRFEDSGPMDPTLFVNTINSEPLHQAGNDESTQTGTGETLLPAELWAISASGISGNTTSPM